MTRAAHDGTDRNGPRYIPRSTPIAFALAQEVNRLLPQTVGQVTATPRRKSKVRRTGPTSPICELCGWQHSKYVVSGRCLDEAACSKRAW